ncbi:hypothetical protein [Victivallis vadensis]|nr:hypothetical protein [Victivallis vadensis]
MKFCFLAVGLLTALVLGLAAFYASDRSASLPPVTAGDMNH